MLNKKNLKILSNLYSSTFLGYILNGSYKDYLSYILNSIYDINSSGLLLKNLLEQVYIIISEKYRCEYVYKNTITNSILSKRHALDSTIILNEFRVGSSKADLVVLNGTSTAYEIKTELDNLDRLESQLASYRKCFDKIFIVTYGDNIKKISSLVDKHIGLIIILDDLSIEMYKDSESNIDSISPEILFPSFRKHEYTSIIESEYGYVPDVPNTRIYDECKKLFSRLTPEKANTYMIQALKSRNINNCQTVLLENAPNALKMFCLHKLMSAKECSRVDLAFNSSF